MEKKKSNNSNGGNGSSSKADKYSHINLERKIKIETEKRPVSLLANLALESLIHTEVASAGATG